jgi:hypothetical protein
LVAPATWQTKARRRVGGRSAEPSGDGGARSEEAKHSARRESGNLELVMEVTREASGWGSLDRMMQDLRFGVRMLAKSPGFTAVAVLTLALGIGANTVLFLVLNDILMNPLPYPEPEKLITLHESKPNFEVGSISELSRLAKRKHNVFNDEHFSVG